MFSVKTSKIMENLVMGRGNFATDTAGNRAWTSRFAAKAKVPNALVAAAFFGQDLNQKVGGKAVHSSEMIGRLAKYVGSKLENRDLSPNAQHNLQRVAHFISNSVAARLNDGLASIHAARETPAAARPQRAAVPQGLEVPQQAGRAAPAPRAGAAPSPEATAAFNSGLVAANIKFKEGKGLVAQMEGATGLDRARLKVAAKKSFREARDSLSALLKEPDARTQPKHKLALSLRNLANTEIRALV